MLPGLLHFALFDKVLFPFLFVDVLFRPVALFVFLIFLLSYLGIPERYKVPGTLLYILCLHQLLIPGISQTLSVQYRFCKLLFLR